MAHAHEYSFPKDLESQAWFVDSDASHHLTFNPCFLHTDKSYNGMSCVHIVNGLSLPIQFMGSPNVNALSCSSIGMTLNDILLVHCITCNILSIPNS